MSNRIFLHGVPDTPRVWGALIEALGEDVLTPCLPGFCAPPPRGFGSTKDEYAEWLIRLLEDQYAAFGPIDIFGHDWGALLTLRVVSLRPQLIKSWAISGATIDPDYRGHAVAHLWNAPLAGEVAMALSPARMMEIVFRLNGLPRDIAGREASAWCPHMRRSILALYRSANAPVAQRFAEKYRTALHIEHGAGHWAIVERSQTISKILKLHWSE